MLLLGLCIIFIAFGVIKYILYVQHVENYVKHLKSVSPRWPFIGNVTFFMGKSMQHIYEEMIEVILRTKTPMKVKLGPAYFIIVDGPEDMNTILTSSQCFDKPYIYDLLHIPFAFGTQRCKIFVIFFMYIFRNDRFRHEQIELFLFFFSAGRLWRPLRKLMNPMFSLKRLHAFLPVFNEKSRLTVKYLENEVGKPPFDILQYTSKCTLHAACGKLYNSIDRVSVYCL